MSLVNHYPGLLQDHDAHPGHEAVGCRIQYVVTAAPFGQSSSSNGYGCYATGGHCLPDDKCELRREKLKDWSPE